MNKILTKEQNKRLKKLLNLKMALARIQGDLKIIEDNDIFWGDMMKNFKDEEGILITQKLFNLVDDKEKQLFL